MASPQQQQQQSSYTYTRPSTQATRSLIDSTDPSPEPSGTATPSNPLSPHGTLHRRKTNNYETALADRLGASLDSSTTTDCDTDPAAPNPTSTTTPTSSSNKPVVVGGLAYRGDAAAAKVGHPVSTPLSPATASTERSKDLEGSGHAHDLQAQRDEAGSGRPLLGLLGRQQSWKQSDQKRAAMERMLSTDEVVPVHRRSGYTSGSQPATPV